MAPKNSGKPWTLAQTRKLEELARRVNVPTPDIARRLERTEGSVRSHAQREKISLRPVNK